jgi:hypothetical protein
MLPLRKAYPLVAAGGLVVAAIAFVVAHLVTTPWLDVSIGAALTLDSGLSLGVALASAGLAGLALVAGLRAVQAPIGGWPERLMLAWAAAVSLLAALPSGTPGFVAVVLCAVAFLTLPAATALLVPRLRADAGWEPVARPMEWLALAQGLGLVVLTYVVLPGHQVLIGLVERLLVGVELAVVGVLAVRLVQLAWAGAADRLPKRVTAVGRFLMAAPIADRENAAR